MEGGTGDEGTGGEEEEGGAGLVGKVAKAVPGGGGNLAKFFERVELEIEDQKGEVAITEEKVGTAEGLFGMVATDPEEAGTGGGAVGSGVEGIATVDEGERCVLLLEWRGFRVQGGRRRLGSGGVRLLQQFGEDEREPGGRSGGREFREGASGKGRESGRRFDGRGGALLLMRLRESLLQLLAKMLAKIVAGRGHQIQRRS